MTGQILDFNQAKRQDAPRTGAIDVDDIRARLHADPRAFIQWLYSGRALITKSEARIGNTYGEPGASLSIQLAGKDAGLWHDHATGEGGDLIALYRASMGYQGTANFVLSLKEIASGFLGDPVEVERSSWQPTALERIEQKKQKLGTKPHADMVELGAPVATYKYYDTRGNVVASVNRFEPDGTRESKTFRPYCYRTIDGVTKWIMGAPDLRPLYRQPEIATASTVVLCEGEGCADALNQLGIVATTAMQGAKAPIDKTDWSPLTGKKVIIWPDNDKPGFDYALQVSERLQAIGCTVLGITPPADATPAWDAVDCVADGKDAHALIAGASPIIATPRNKSRIRLMSLSDMANLPPLAWLVEGVVTEHGLSMIWGRSGSLKSFVALDMAMCVATGTPWHGRAVKQGRAIYVAAEGAFGLSRRAIGWRKTRGRDLPEPDILLIPHGVTLTSDDLAEMILAIANAGQEPAFIVVDTLSRTFGGGNPNQPVDMNLYVAAVDKLREATKAHILIVHHAGEDEDRNEIGNKGLRNACDTVIYVKRNKDKVQLINEAPKGKQKDAEEFKTITLRPAKVSFEQNGTEESTLILNLDEGHQADGSDEPNDAPTQKLGGVEKRIVGALSKAAGPLGVTRLAAMTNTQKGTLYSSLESLERKNLVEKVRSEDNSRDEWRLS